MVCLSFGGVVAASAGQLDVPSAGQALPLRHAAELFLAPSGCFF